jgi:YHS domain-containing protein/thiol-disulfide isomerase/thioredoxin
MSVPPSRAPRWAPRVRPLLVLSLVVITGAARAGTAPIPWRTRFESAREEARARNRPLWLQFTGPWCLFCRRMERETFSRPEVIALSRDDFIPVQIRSDQREDLVEFYGVTGLPATVIVAADGRVLARHEGYADPGAFLGFLFAARPPVEPESEVEIALAGYDPVSLVRGNGLTAGRAALAVQHDGQEYRFADEADREAFLRDPERFQPCNRGRCVVNLVDRGVNVRGDARYGVYYRGRLYLCADEEARQRFAADPARYADADIADAGQCPHCRTLAGRLVEGLPQFSLIHQGRRYLFSDRFHLEAFRASPEKYLR